MNKLTMKQKSALKWTLLLIALTNMPALALSPATEQIRNYFGQSLAAVQTAMSSVNIIQIAVALIAMYLINRGIITKKLAVVMGQFFFVLTVIFVIFFHDAFWCIWCLSVLIGCAAGLFVTNAFGIMFDCFTPAERQGFAGLQTSSINAGGIMMSLAGGLLAGFFWYGGYLIFSVGLIFGIIGLINIPSYKTPKPKTDEPQSKIKPRVFYYAAAQLLFMMTYSVVGQNLSSHLSGHFENFSSLAGVCTSVQMAGGFCAGFLFSKLSAKIKDDILVVALCLQFLGFLLLSFFQTSLPLILISVFICGTSISLFNPWCTYGVSVYSDPTNSAVTSVIISAIAPSAGGFLSPVIITNLTNALAAGSTVFRYRFTAFFVLAVALVFFICNRINAKRDSAAAA